MDFKKILVVSWCMLLVSTVYGQYDGRDSLIKSRYRPGFMWFNTGWRPALVEKPRKYDRLILDITYSSLLTKNGKIDSGVKNSIGFNINTMWDIPITKGNGCALGVGLAYKQLRVGYNGLIVRDFTTQSTVFEPEMAGVTYPEKQLFGTNSFVVPFELRFRMKKWKHVKLHLGGSVGYRFDTYTKMWYNQNKVKIRDAVFYDDAHLQYGIHARLGIRNWAIFADYTLSNSFENKNSTAVHPVSFGLSISLF